MKRSPKNSTLSIHFTQDHHCCRQQPFLLVNKFLSNHGPKPSSPNVQTQTFNTDCVLETQATTIGNTAPWRTVFALYMLLKHSDTSTICNLGWECYKNLKGFKHLSTPLVPKSKNIQWFLQRNVSLRRQEWGWGSGVAVLEPNPGSANRTFN